MYRRTFCLFPLGLLLRGKTILPAALERHSGVHPRLFFNSARFDTARKAITGSHLAQWAVIERLVSCSVAIVPPTEHDDGDGEQLWQREVGNTQPYLAIAYRLTDDRRYLRAAEQWCLASCGYSTWGPDWRDGGDLPAGHQLMDLALCYDWLFDDLAPEAKQTIRATLVRRGRQMFEAANFKQYWRNSYLQNHLWVNVAGLAAAALALFDEPDIADEARAWIELALEKFRRTEQVLGPDGASHEGVGYWSYGIEYMLKFWTLAFDLLGEDMSSGWWKLTALYRIYMGLPRNAWSSRNTIVNIADCQGTDWSGPEYMLRRLAQRNRDGRAQWLAAELESAQIVRPAAAWLSLLWYAPEVQSHPPADLPTLRHFFDMGIVSARSGWSGDESLLVFKCGPPIGHEATWKFKYDPGSGHVHPDVNHFVLFGVGEWLIRDDGYAWKQTSQHNT